MWEENPGPGSPLRCCPASKWRGRRRCRIRSPCQLQSARRDIFSAIHVSLDPQDCKIFRRAPIMERAKGPLLRGQPLGRITMIVANSFRSAFKWPPRRPRWFETLNPKVYSPTLSHTIYQQSAIKWLWENKLIFSDGCNYPCITTSV